MEPFGAFLIIAAIFAVAVWLAHWCGKNRNGAGLVGLAVVWAGFTGAMFFGLERATGWDGLGYLVALIGISAPAGLGALIGCAVGWFKNEMAIHA